jgi:hypothetical protein
MAAAKKFMCDVCCSFEIFLVPGCAIEGFPIICSSLSVSRYHRKAKLDFDTTVLQSKYL